MTNQQEEREVTEIQPYTPSTGDLAPTDTWVPVLQDVAYLASRIADTDYVPTAYRGKPAAVAATILYGRELSLPPMTSLRAIDPIKGTPSLSAEAMRALIVSAGHHYRFIETTATRCVMEGRRRDEESWTRVAYTMDEAKQSGDAAKNQQYRTRPAEMLIARATSRLARMIFADCIGGFPSPEEVYEDAPEVTPDEPTTVTVIREEPKPKPKPRPRKVAAKPAAAPAAEPEPPALAGPPLPGEDGFEDMVPVEEPPADEPAEVVEESKRTEAQSKKLFACLRSLGIASRDEGLEMVASILGHPVESTKDLTKSQAAKVIDALESMESEVLDAEVME